MVRAVARVDVISEVGDLYDLKSVSIGGVPTQGHLLPDSNFQSYEGHFQQFYGTGDGDAVVENNRVTGGLYTFRNFEGDPVGHPETTTSLIIKLSPKASAPADAIIGTPGANYFYRVDICPENSGQNILRNNIYVVSLHNVLEVGKTNVDDALYTPGGLDYTINNWSVDDEGMVVTDGQSTMAIPSKFVRFGPAADSRSYEIFTVGPGELRITRTDLPGGLRAELEGNTLTVFAEALPEYSLERSGTLELGYGGLRATVTVIQTPTDDRFIEFDKTVLTPWDSAVTGDSPAENLLTVSASGEWTAKIYNTSADEQNPGFAFNNVSSGDAPVTTIASGMPGQTVKIYSTGPNPTRDFRQGFMIATLTGPGGEEYSTVVVLTQNSKGVIRIEPDYVNLPFDAVGNATGIIGGSPEDTNYRIDVFPGSDAVGGPLRKWKYELTGADAAKFSVVRVDDPLSPYLIVSAIGDDPAYPGLNKTGAKAATLTISLDLGGGVEDLDPVVLDITQEALTFSVKRVSQLSRVPVTGSERVTKVYTDDVKRDEILRRDSEGQIDCVEYEVEMSSALRYDVTMSIVSNTNAETLPYRRHEGYFVGDDGRPMTGVTELTSRPATNTVRIGFDKIYYPMVHWSDTPSSPDYNIPEVELTFSVPEIEDIEPVKIRVQQEPLVAQPLDVLMSSYRDGEFGGYASFGVNGQEYALNLRNTYLNEVSVNTGVNFGTNGVVRTQNDPRGSLSFANVNTWTDATAVPVNPKRNFVYAGSHNSGFWESEGHRAVENWRRLDNNQGFVYFTGLDEAFDDYATTSLGDIKSANSTLMKLGWQFIEDNTLHNNDDVVAFDSGDSGKRVAKYVVNGPFGDAAGTLSLDVDGYHSSIARKSLGPNTVVIFTESTKPDNVLLAIDPVARVAYLGESQLFFDTATDANERRLTGNFFAIFVNSAQYGDHFLELLYEDCPLPLYLPGQTAPLIAPAP
jgi:hypothetical protein